MSEEKPWSKEFTEYEDFIVYHKNYKGLSITKREDGKYNWITTAQSEIGKQRKTWAEKKGAGLGILNNTNGFYAAVMLAIHPTKKKPCQICGKSMSLFYHYPNANLARALKKEFDYDCDIYESIYDICNNIKNKGIPEKHIIEFLKTKCKLEDTYTDIETLICHCELKCRSGNSKMLGPGAMSNFPDRYDGFHTYNRCCRAKEDKGRSRENLRTYGKDRRAYEYFSDGNIHAADRFMTSPFFKNSSADHILPVSLGGVHDPCYLQKMPTGYNSSKRDRLVKEDVVKAIEIEKRTGTPAVSWFALILWEYLKKNVMGFRQSDLENFRVCMKQNMNDFLSILCQIKEVDNNAESYFITEKLIKPKHKYFISDYNFNSDGSYTETKRHITERTSEEFERMKRIGLDSLDEYKSKNNRNMSEDFTICEKNAITNICNKIKSKKFNEAFSLLQNIMKEIQKRELQKFQKSKSEG